MEHTVERAESRPDDSLEPRRWQPLLRTRALGRGDVLWRYSLPSTNTCLRQMAEEGAPHGSLALCETQTAGRGRLGRTWVSPPGAGLWQSVLLRPDLEPDALPLLTFCAALAMSDAIRACGGPEAGLKWPNDLVCGGKKICGILLEAGGADGAPYVIAGAGLNVAPAAVPEELRGQAACLADFGPAPKRGALLAAYLGALEAWTDRLRGAGFAPLKEALGTRCVTLGRPVRVTGGTADGGTGFEGTAEAVDGSGALLVRTADGLRRVLAGDVSVRGVMGYV